MSLSQNRQLIFGQILSARVWHEIVIETDPTISFNPVIYNDADTGRTIVDYHVLDSPRHAEDKAPAPERALVSRDVNNPCIIKVGFLVQAPAGSNPLEGEDNIPLGAAPAPPIQYGYFLRFDLSKDELYIGGYYGKFPAHELYITGDTGFALAPVQSMPFGPFRTPADLYTWPAFFYANLKLWPGDDGQCDCQ